MVVTIVRKYQYAIPRVDAKNGILVLSKGAAKHTRSFIGYWAGECTPLR